MNITKRHLKKIIQEELQNMLNELGGKVDPAPREKPTLKRSLPPWDQPDPASAELEAEPGLKSPSLGTKFKDPSQFDPTSPEHQPPTRTSKKKLSRLTRRGQHMPAEEKYSMELVPIDKQGRDLSPEKIAIARRDNPTGGRKVPYRTRLKSVAAGKGGSGRRPKRFERGEVYNLVRPGAKPRTPFEKKERKARLRARRAFRTLRKQGLEESRPQPYDPGPGSLKESMLQDLVYEVLQGILK